MLKTPLPSEIITNTTYTIDIMSNYRSNNKRGSGGRDHYNERGRPLQPRGNQPNPTYILVDTNQFELKIEPTNRVTRNTDTSEYIQYEGELRYTTCIGRGLRLCVHIVGMFDVSRVFIMSCQ